jgi:hypothetical protein
MKTDADIKIDVTQEVDWYPSINSNNLCSDKTGFLGVTNNIAIKPSIAPSDVRDRIWDALKRHAEREADDIEVTVTGSLWP